MSEDRTLCHVSFEGIPSTAVSATERRWIASSTPPARPPLPPAIAGTEPPPHVPSEPALALAAWVLGRAGLDSSAYRAESLRRRVPACLRAVKARSAHDARQRIAARPQLLAPAISALLIGVTELFRDRGVFAALRTTVLPALGGRAAPLRAWSAACASGAEMYSFAALLAEAGLLDRTYLLGTDCRPDVIAQAVDGTCVTGTPWLGGEALFTNCFEPTANGGWRPIERLRRSVEWRIADLLKVTEPGPWDVIFWRNAAIYLNPDCAVRVYSRLVAEMSPGGFLVVGKAERPPVTAALVPVSRCIYRKRGA